ncbi:LysR substrate-binding domain-containing protein [Paracoccus sp. DMF-8]|uniref:LysR substrate-binding domain-containing protein n=1 Tax=Paracoccus sp. DMF-8 TaxID=3019445 RepID=UPI0023E8A406|nr:LysR substrate-binding domain-containing protein [Paracoccus sp. DMF-8]MDF3604699.1 LysR substrate-binding domain-containing protein [Paracoccus sp. DMF-8]
MHDHVAAQAAAMGITLRHRLRLRSFDAICRMVGAGVGIAIIPEAAARRACSPPAASPSPPVRPRAAATCRLCQREDTPLSPVARSLFDHLAQGG